MGDVPDFGWALEMLRQGNRVMRLGWNGKGAWLVLVHASFWRVHLAPDYDTNAGGAILSPWIGMKTADDKFVPWLASQTDVLAEDWCIVE